MGTELILNRSCNIELLVLRVNASNVSRGATIYQELSHIICPVHL